MSGQERPYPPKGWHIADTQALARELRQMETRLLTDLSDIGYEDGPPRGSLAARLWQRVQGMGTRR